MITFKIDKTIQKQNKQPTKLSACITGILSILAVTTFICLGTHHIDPFRSFANTPFYEALEAGAAFVGGGLVGAGFVPIANKVSDASREFRLQCKAFSNKVKDKLDYQSDRKKVPISIMKQNSLYLK